MSVCVPQVILYAVPGHYPTSEMNGYKRFFYWVKNPLRDSQEFYLRHCLTCKILLLKKKVRMCVS